MCLISALATSETGNIHCRTNLDQIKGDYRISTLNVATSFALFEQYGYWHSYVGRLCLHSTYEAARVGWFRVILGNTSKSGKSSKRFFIWNVLNQLETYISYPQTSCITRSPSVSTFMKNIFFIIFISQVRVPKIYFLTIPQKATKLIRPGWKMFSGLVQNSIVPVCCPVISYQIVSNFLAKSAIIEDGSKDFVIHPNYVIFERDQAT